MPPESRRYHVDPSFAMPALDRCAPPDATVLARPPVISRATQYDTADRRLARSGASLQHSRGEAHASASTWTVTLPPGPVGSRHEVSRPGTSSAVPDELCWLVSGYTRGASLAPAAVVRTVRTAYEVQDSSERPLVDIADDVVRVLDGRRVALSFREIEVRRLAGRPKLLDTVEAVLRTAGAAESGFAPKHVRALGAAAARPPDLVPPGTVGPDPGIRDVVVATLRRDIERILVHDPLVRLRTPLPDGDTAVHRMRVGCRRLRSDLRLFDALLDEVWSTALRAELRWLAERLGAARDGEVLRDRLHRTAAADPLAPLDPVGVARIDADLTARHEEALTALDQALCSDRYLALLDVLIGASARPPLTKAARGPASETLPALVGRPWRRLWAGGGGRLGAAALEADAPDEEWHEVRIRAKRARYAVEAVVEALGGPPGATALARALAAVQGVLGEHQDAATAARTWLGIADADPDDHPLAVTAGRLFERERAAVRRARADFDGVWQAAGRKHAVEWLR